MIRDWNSLRWLVLLLCFFSFFLSPMRIIYGRLEYSTPSPELCFVSLVFFFLFFFSFFYMIGVPTGSKRNGSGKGTGGMYHGQGRGRGGG